MMSRSFSLATIISLLNENLNLHLDFRKIVTMSVGGFDYSLSQCSESGGDDVILTLF